MPTAVRRPGYVSGGGTAGMADWITRTKRANPDYQVPGGYEEKDGRYVRDNHGVIDTIAKYAPIAGLGVGGGLYAAGIAGGAGGAAPTIATGVPAGLPGAVPGIGAAAGAGGGMFSNPATAMLISSLIQSGLGFAGGLLGGNDQQERQGYSGRANPQTMMEDFISKFGGAQRVWADNASKPVQLRNAGVQQVKPVNVPGLPFQIGGAFGMDPAMRDPSMLSYAQPNYADAFGSAAQGGATGQAQPKTPTRRRKPTSGSKE